MKSKNNYLATSNKFLETKQNKTPRLSFNKVKGPVIHMKVQQKYKDDLFLLEDENKNPIIRVHNTGYIEFNKDYIVITTDNEEVEETNDFNNEEMNETNDLNNEEIDRDDLIAINNEEKIVINNEDKNGNVNESIAIDSEEQKKCDFTDGIILGKWKIVPTDEHLLVQKLEDGTWVTKQLLT